MEKDTNYYYHGDGNQNITVLQDGLYLLSFNSPRLTTTGQREAPQFTIYVNDVAQDGSRTGATYIRDSDGAEESSTVITYALNLSANDDIEIGVNRSDPTTTTAVDDQDEGVIFIEYKGALSSEGGWVEWSNVNNPNTESPWNWDFDFPNGTGYYEFYSIGKKSGSTDEIAPNSADAICRFNRIPTIIDEGPSNESTNIELTPQMNITVNDSDGDTMTINWYSNSSGSWIAFGTNNSVSNGTYHQTNYNFSDAGTTYWWYITASDEVHTNTSDIFHFTTLAVSPPVVLTNQSTGIEETNATLNGYLLGNGGLDTTCGFRFGTSSGSYSENYTKGIYPSNTEFSNNNGSLTQGQIYFYQAWASNSQGFANGEEMVFLTKPEPPTNLIVQANNSDDTIYLSWTLGTGANTTYIERNASGITSWDRGEGIFVYNGTGTNLEDSDLTEGVTYYYKAWSFANWTYDSTLHQWSDNNATGSNTTNNKPTIELVLPSPNGTTGISLQPTCQIWANDTDGDTLTVYWYENSTGSYILRNINSSVSANSTVNYTFTQFNGYGNTYYWKVAINDTKDNVTAWFYFTTTPLDTSVNTITPYNISSTPFIITATNNTPVDNVTLWYRYSSVNGSWAHYETGIEQNVNGWTTVNLENTYENPVVIVTGQEGEDISLDIQDFKKCQKPL